MRSSRSRRVSAWDLDLRSLLVLACLGLVMAACGAPRTDSASRSAAASQRVAAVRTPAPAAKMQAAADTALTAAQSQTQAGNLTCSSSGGGGSPRSTRIQAANASDDTFTLTFDGAVPAFKIELQQNTRFVRSPSNIPVTLPGSAGVLITFTGLNFPATAGLPNSFSPGGQLLLQVLNVQDFEGVVQYAAGLSASACAAALVSGSTVTFHFLATGKG